MAGIYDVGGKILVTISPGGSVWRGVYAPDGSWYVTMAPGNAYVGAYAPDGSLYVTDATGSTTVGLIAPDGSLRMTSNYENNGALVVSGLFSPVTKYDFTANVGLGVPSFLTHSRAGNAMMTDASGKLTYAPNNLLTYSNTFSNAAWENVAPLVTSNGGVQDPFGGSNASTIVIPAGGRAVQYRTLPVGNYAAGIWLKGSGSITLGLMTNAYALRAQTSYTLTNTWTFVYAVGATSGADTIAGIFIGSVSGATVSIYAGALSAVTYETAPRQQDQVITTAAAYYGPRIETSGLLIEAARTNLVTYSNALTDASWTATGGVSVSPNATVSPEGLTNAFKISETAVFAGKTVQKAITVPAGSTITASGYWKAGERSIVVLNPYDTADRATFFNLATGTVGTNAPGSTATITPVGNGWYRCSVSRTVSGATVYFIWQLAQTDGTLVYTGTAGSGAYAYGAQLEVGSFPTSYITTGAAAVTRAADSLTAASYSSNPAIIEYTPISTGVTTRKVVNPSSGISSEQNERIKGEAIYPTGTPTATLDRIATQVGGLWT